MSMLRDVSVRAALVVSLLLPLYFLVAALGTKFGLFDWTFGFGVLTYVWGARVMLGAAALAFVAVLLAFMVAPRRGVAAAVIALALPLAGLGYGVYVGAQARDIPPIHDISTDLEDPPGFSPAVVEARAGVVASNGLDLLSKRTGDGRAFVDLQREAYGDVTHIVTGLAPGVVYDMALALARERGWAIGRADAADGAIEATDTTFWFGFTDDIAIRIRPDGEGARIDMRSVSRVGRSDLGANAARMRPYLAELRARIQAEESR